MLHTDQQDQFPAVDQLLALHKLRRHNDYELATEKIDAGIHQSGQLHRRADCKLLEALATVLGVQCRLE